MSETTMCSGSGLFVVLMKVNFVDGTWKSMAVNKGGCRNGVAGRNLSRE